MPACVGEEESRKIVDIFTSSACDRVSTCEPSPILSKEICQLVDAYIALEKATLAQAGGTACKIYSIFGMPPPEAGKVTVICQNETGQPIAYEAEVTEDGIICNGNPKRPEEASLDPTNAIPRNILIVPGQVELKSFVAKSPSPSVSVKSSTGIAGGIENIKINGEIYTIPSNALKGIDIEYARNAITDGQRLLADIRSRNISALEENSPIKSRQDMVDLMWAICAEAWKIDPNYQAGSSAAYVADPDRKMYAALKHAKDGDFPLAYFRGSANDSSHLKPFKESKESQCGLDAYAAGTSATSKRNEILPYGRGTLLFGQIKASESMFVQDRTFIKLEDYGTDNRSISAGVVAQIRGRVLSFWNLLRHGYQWLKKTVLRIGLPDKTQDFTEKTEAIFKKVASFCKKGSEGVSLSLKEGAKAAAEKGLTALAKFVTEQKRGNETAVDIEWLGKVEEEISSWLEKDFLKDYQMLAIGKWKRDLANQGRSTLAYFETHDQSAREIVIDLVT
ncbi:MAG: hypothetical protein LBF42_00665 [Puniceicoccales bacterium]|nr:hypothetical protein [Puniceicoccales bacterium]